MQDKSGTLSGKRIGIFGKGGAGKSTVAVLIAKVLRTLGYQVCVLDADSTNVGLSRAFGISPTPKTLLDYYGGNTSGLLRGHGLQWWGGYLPRG